MNELKLSRAIISVSDKNGIAELAVGLVGNGVALLSTGGTHNAIASAQVAVSEVSSHTGFPEMMDGRVKTLHPKIHGGILGRRGLDDSVMNEHSIEGIDLVVVNLYPFEATLLRDDCTRAMAIENIDIGGPAMVRSAAKNHQDVVVIVDPDDYADLLDRIKNNKIDLAFRERMAAKAFRHTAAYDAAVAEYLSQDEPFPESLTLKYRHRQSMRYGENPHQAAAFYVESNPPRGSVATIDQEQGKELSYNNVADTDAALECVKSFQGPACVIVKHANPCGVATSNSIADAYSGAFATDPTSAFGGIIAFNRPLDQATMAAIVEKQFAEVVVAPEIGDGVREIARKRKNLRLLSTGSSENHSRGREFKRVGGGILVQQADEICMNSGELEVVTARGPTPAELADMEFAWRVAWYVKSNAIVFARDQRTIGVGAGQMSRVVSAKIAKLKADEEGLEVAGSVMASDAFFPFRDGIDTAAEVGITAVIQPGGSVRDKEVIEAANENDIAMVFTGVRHFRH